MTESTTAKNGQPTRIFQRTLPDMAALAEAIILSSSDAIITKSLDGIIMSWNPAAQHIFGYSADEVIGRHITILFPSDHVDEETRILAKIRNGEQIDHYETVRKRKDGSLVPISLTISPIKDGNGAIIGASKIVRDITAQKEQEKKLIAQTNELEQFAYVASHDLKEPLRKISLFSQMLIAECKGVSGPKAGEYSAAITDAVDRMQALITSLLSFSKSDLDELRFEEMDLGLVVEGVISDLQVAIQETQAVIELSDLPTLNANRFQMHQLFQNLISNALKFRGPENPLITITGKTDGDFYVIAVKDNGIGFRQEYAARIFRVFQRLNTKRDFPGTGIGLAICKKIVNRHNGRIWAESTEGEGSTFFVALPRTLA